MLILSSFLETGRRQKKGMGFGSDGRERQIQRGMREREEKGEGERGREKEREGGRGRERH